MHARLAMVMLAAVDDALLGSAPWLVPASTLNSASGAESPPLAVRAAAGSVAASSTGGLPTIAEPPHTHGGLHVALREAGASWSPAWHAQPPQVDPRMHTGSGCGALSPQPTNEDASVGHNGARAADSGATAGSGKGASSTLSASGSVSQAAAGGMASVVARHLPRRVGTADLMGFANRKLLLSAELAHSATRTLSMTM